jgi:hypothetical protein
MEIMERNTIHPLKSGDTLIKIAHRGNTIGRNLERENHPLYIEEVLREDYAIEVDLWCDSGNILRLGHDKPTYEIPVRFLYKYSHRLWIHCKNIESLLYMRGNLPDLNYFFHDSDDVVLTSKGFLWHYPMKGPFGHNSICVLPEWNGDYNNVPICYGVCSDYVGLIDG